MAQRNIICSVHYNGVISNDLTNGFSFSNTETKRFKVHCRADFMHLKERIETKLQLPVSEIIYRLPLFNGDSGIIFYVMKPIEDEDGVKVMFECHNSFAPLDDMELYVHIVSPPINQSQESHSHQYGLSQPTDEEPTQNNEPFIPDEQVDEYSEDEIQEVQYEDLFGDDNDPDIVEPSQPTLARPISMYAPPDHMRNICLEEAPSESVFGSHITNYSDVDLYEGMEFEDKEECVAAMQHWHITNNLDYWVYKSDTKRYVIKCKNPTCKFKCRASVRKKNSKWMIGKLSGPHVCTTTSMSQDHRQLTSDIVSHCIRDLVNTDPSIKEMWIAKVKAIESLYGNWETSYNDLPRWLLVMKTYLPGMIIDLETLPAFSNEGSQLGDKMIFHRLFWAFQPCIHGFAYCKPIVQVDGTWLYGRYKGTLLMAVAQDGNGNIFPIAFAIVEGETKDAWSFFLRNLRIHVTPQPNLCLISDRHPSIKSVYDDPANGWQNPPSSHVYCIRHIAQNFMRAIRDKELRKKLVNMGYALTESTYNYYRTEIRQTNRDAMEWIENIPREKWARAFDRGQRWGHMTTNLAEAMNSVLKATRNLPIASLFSATYFRMGALFGQRGHEWTKRLTSGQTFTDKCIKGMTKEVNKASSHNVYQFDRERFYFMVAERINRNDGRPTGTYGVDLRKRTCDCGKFQAFHLPCSHVIAACESIRQDYTIHIPDVFKIQHVFKVYQQSFQILPHQDNWPQYRGPTLCHDETMRRKKRGRPNSTRIRTEMDDVEKEKRMCGICREVGHIRSKCPNVSGPSNRPP
ncbi:uncharacterized protein LOC131661500 [Vicia villosa]|uniref:uncharacterized protein LOC131661500 n=1 Tax=Vicia villosa TaxID=3911 RepID=UPI00273AA0EF|nr:uncharacterized protein LOC131661500 [Vicia villosa]